METIKLALEKTLGQKILVWLRARKYEVGGGGNFNLRKWMWRKMIMFFALQGKKLILWQNIHL